MYNDPTGLDWIKSTGNRIYWYAGDFGNETTLLKTFKATSGIKGFYPGQENAPVDYQYANYQTYTDEGPTVEGVYSINLVPSPNRVAKINDKQMLDRTKVGGIEEIPQNENGKTLFLDWGYNRVRLEPILVKDCFSGVLVKPKKYSESRDIYSFYFHDSQKGYTHGCTEIEPIFFDYLKEFRLNNPEIKKIEIKIEYPTEEHNTNANNPL